MNSYLITEKPASICIETIILDFQDDPKIGIKVIYYKKYHEITFDFKTYQVINTKVSSKIELKKCFLDEEDEEFYFVKDINDLLSQKRFENCKEIILKALKDNLDMFSLQSL
jgi:hypothetical protein